MEFNCGPLRLRPNKYPKGTIVPEHMHEFGHVTFFFSQWRGKRWRRALDESKAQIKAADGTEVWVQVSDQVYNCGDWCLIEKDVKHSFEALEDGLLICTYPHRDPQTGEVVDDYLGWEKAYE